MPKRPCEAQEDATLYMMDVMRRLEWDMHNAIELSGRIPDEWTEIARRERVSVKEKVTLYIERDVMRFYRSMGAGVGPRINDVLKTFMLAKHARLLRGETIAWHRTEKYVNGEKPKFGFHEERFKGWDDMAMPEGWGTIKQSAKEWDRERRQRAKGEGG